MIPKTYKRLVGLLVLLTVLPTTICWAQLSSQAQIAGLVADGTGASIPEAEIKATNTATNVEYRSVSNEAGAYIISSLVPGPYKVTVSKTGFKTTLQTGVVARAGDRLSLNFTLELGEFQTTIEVNAAGELLTTDDATYSTVLDNKMITALPQISRSTLDLLPSVAPAMQGRGPNTLSTSQSFSGIGTAGTAFALGGGQRNGASITVDGTVVQDQENGNVNRAIPTPDSVGEFRVQTGVLTADVGRYSGGVITMSTQSGTNEYHGRLFFYGRNQNLNSNTWQNNALGVEKKPFHQNNYGLALGGPVSIPKVYKGKERTFFFFSWEAERFSDSSLGQASVPTEAERRGDFSQSIINQRDGRPVYARIFDMFAGFHDAQGNWVRPEFPNATIPKERQVALMPYFMDLFPLPNHAPDANTSSTNNYWGFIDRKRRVDQETLRLDHNLTSNQRLYARVSHYRGRDITPPVFAQTYMSDLYDNNWGGSLAYNWTISPSSILNMNLGTTMAKFASYQGSTGSPQIDTTRWPFDPMVFQSGLRSNKNIAPGLRVGGGYTDVGTGQYDQYTNQVHTWNFSFTKVWNRHTFKMGYDGRWAFANENGGDSTGLTRINSGGGSNQSWNNNDGLTGHPLAALMLGSSSFFSWANWNIAPYGPLHGAFVMNDWKVNTKLTMQLGLRYDYERGRKARYPYGVIMDLDAKNVRTPNATWDWNQVLNAVPGLGNYPSPTWLREGVNGRSCFIQTPECPQDTVFRTDNGVWQPRIGVSYGLDSNTVLHASFGSVFQSFSGFETKIGGSFYYPYDTFTQIPTIDGKRWVSELGLDHGLGPFPRQPDGSNLGYVPAIGTNAAFWNATFGGLQDPIYGYSAPSTAYKSPTEYIWGLGIERKFGKWVASAQYQGIHGVNLLTIQGQYRYNYLEPKYYGLGAQLLAPVPNPFFGQSQNDAGAPNVPLWRLLSNMPQYRSAAPGYLGDGHSMSNFLNLQVQSRDFHGLSLLAAYNIRKTLVNNVGKDVRLGGRLGNLQDGNDLEEAYGVALYEVPQTLLLNYYYDLPVGRGKQWLGNPQGWSGRLLNATIGGWGLAGVTRWWPKGTPVAAPVVNGSISAPNARVRWSVSNPDYKNSSVDYEKGLIVSGRFVHSDPSSVFNKGVFVRTPNYSFGNIPAIFPNVRNPGGFSTDGTLFKDFYFSGDRRRYVNVRAEALNLFNHPNFGAVNNNPDSPTFGGINGKSGGRVMQIGLRLFF